MAASRALRCSLSIAVTTLVMAASAHAHPFLPMRELPSAIAGPSEPHVAGIVYNPAALGLLRGVHLYLDGNVRVGVAAIQLDGQASSVNTFASPAGFVGVASNFRDRITLAFAVHTPYSDLARFSGPPTANARRYDFAALEETIGAGFRVSNRFAFGASFSGIEGWGDLRFDRDVAPAGGAALVDNPNALCGSADTGDAPCGYGNPRARQAITAQGFQWGLLFAIGVVGRPIDRLWLSLAYRSRVFRRGTAGDLALFGTRGGIVTPASGATVRSATRFDTPIPNVLTASGRVLLPRSLELELVFRWTNWGAYSSEDVILQGGQLASLASPPAAAIPARFVFDRGLRDAYLVSLSMRIPYGTRIRFMPYLGYESPAVERGRVSAASLDAHKVDASLVMSAKLGRTITLGAHLGLTMYALGRVDSKLSSQLEKDCVDANYALTSAACAATAAGRGWPSSSGRYTYMVPHLGLSMDAAF